MSTPAESLAFGPDRAPACAATTVPGTAVLAFQRVARAHQAEAYCQGCQVAHDVFAVPGFLEEDAEGELQGAPCPGCGADSLVLIDAFTAGVVVQVHAALNETNRVKLEGFDAVLIAAACMKLSAKGK